MSFLSPVDKFMLLSRCWSVFFMLHYIAASQPPPLNHLKLNELVNSAKIDQQLDNLDSEELRLATSYLLSKLGRKNAELGFATALDETYRYWLSRHCATFHPNSPLRDERIMRYADSLLLHCEQISMDGEFSTSAHPANVIRAALNTRTNLF
ncbi:unnamed protein product [Gongylonema pulchrum]|uniref:Uncharacterized protein n=1 Tax=Gongylonema pulchrum TaxID=637853 RepID=A0A183DT03_9BILA|nr:unnamed protein product [Gongylonema pulchrum]